MATDNGIKDLKRGKVPVDGDLLKYSEASGGWIPVTVDDVLATATVLGIYTLPTVDGASGDVLSTDGSGVLSWITP